MAPDPTPTTGARRALAALLAVGLTVLALTAWTGRDRDRIRNPDEAAYAEQAASLLATGGFDVGHVRFYHVRHDPEITRPEDFYPPGNGVVLAGAWALFGRSDFVSTLPSMAIACLLLPLLTFALARRLDASPPFAFGAGVAVMMEPLIRFHAYQGLADLPFSASVLAAVVLALRPGHTTAALAGAALGLGFWCKPTALLFGPGFAVALTLVVTGSWRVRVARLAWFGLAFAAVAAPWMIRNLELFGDPIYSGNKYLTGTANEPGFDYSHIRRVYWHRGVDVPSLGASASAFGWGPVLRRFAVHIYEILVMHSAATFGFVFALGAVVLRGSRPVLAVLGLVVTFCLALSAVFAVYHRYLMPLFPLVAAVTWAFGDRVAAAIRAADHPLARSRLARSSWRTALVLAAIASIPSGTQIARDLALGKTDFAEPVDRGAEQAARWARDHLPDDAVVMVHEALRFRHCSGLKVVNTPWDGADAIEAVVDHYGVDYAVQTFDGDGASQSNAFFEPYLDRYGAKWTRHEIPGGSAVLWIRAGSPAPSGS